MARRARLQVFLGERFTDSKNLRAFVADTFGTDALNSIGWESGVNAATNDLITWLEANNRVAELWPALRAAFTSLANEITALEKEWKPARFVGMIPSVLRRSRPLQLAVVALIIAVPVTIALWPRHEAYSNVVILDVNARAVAGEVEPSPYVLWIDGTSYPIPLRGLSIGKGPTLPREVARAYHEVVGNEAVPQKIDIKLTTKLISTMKVTFQAEGLPPVTCNVKPELGPNENKLWVLVFESCE